MKKIGVISDTHGLLRPEVKEYLKDCDIILHGGDINKPGILNELREIAPVCAVCGNADVSWAEIEGLPETRRVKIFGLKIFMIHNKGQIKEDISDCNLVVFGHSHKYLEKTEDGIFWLNPGSCGPRRFNMPITMAIIDVEDDGQFTVKKIAIPHPEPKQGKTADTKSSKALSNKASKSSQNNSAKTAVNNPAKISDNKKPAASISAGKLDDRADTVLIEAIIHDVDAGKSISSIAKKYSLPEDLTEQICRLYLTHPGVDAEGIINKMMIAGL